jgi:hypothetical protein
MFFSGIFVSKCHFQLNYFYTDSSNRSLTRQSFCMLLAQEAHNVCNSLQSPQASHRVRFFLSWRALPTNCRLRFLEWVVFFLGTARRMASQMPAKMGIREAKAGKGSREAGGNGDSSGAGNGKEVEF